MDNKVLKYQERQQPAGKGGHWVCKSRLGTFDIQMEPGWTGNNYVLLFEGEKVFEHFA